MPHPNSLRQAVREDAERAINRRLEQDMLDESDLDMAAEEWDLDEYESFFADCREAGHDTSRCGAIWTRLKERGDAPTGGTAGDDMENDDAPEAAMPALPVPETIDELEAEFQDADNVHLLVTTGCPSCNQAKDALSDWIDDGLVDVANVQESDLAADIVIETGLDALPALVMENDGEFTPV